MVFVYHLNFKSYLWGPQISETL